MLDEVYHSVAARAVERQLLEAPVGIDAIHRWHPLPRAVASQLPREHIVSEGDLKNLCEAGAQLEIGDWRHRFDAAVQVALHDVRGAEIVVRLASAAKAEYARMLEEIGRASC